MNRRNVGNSGLRVSSIGLGCNNFGMRVDAADSRKIIQRALDLGITLFDTAPVYGNEWGASENILREALGHHRQEVVIVTKFGTQPNMQLGPDTSRGAILRDIEASLQRLGTDYIDLYMLHWPDNSTPLQETLRTLEDIVRTGKARYIGCCNLPAWQVVESKWLSKTEGLREFIVAQDEYSLAYRAAEKQLLPALNHYGMGFMPYAPLANGLLTGKYSAGTAAPEHSRLAANLWKTGDLYLTEKNLALVAGLSAFAARRGRTLLELAISWLLANPAVCSVIAGATRLEQLEANTSAGEWQLSSDELAEIDQICKEFG